MTLKILKDIALKLDELERRIKTIEEGVTERRTGEPEPRGEKRTNQNGGGNQ